MVDLLCLRRPTKISKLLEDIPQHPFSLPRQILPGWETLPLSSKLPLPRVLCKKINFRRSKLGQSVWQRSNDYDVRFTRFRFDYEPLSDQHLKKFFNQLVFKERVVYHQLIDCNTDEVLCGLKEFNEFRSYLNELQLKEIHKRLKDADRKERDNIWLKRIDQFILRLHKKEERQSLYPRKKEMLENLQHLRQRFLLNRIKEYKHRLSAIAERKAKQQKEILDKQTEKWVTEWLRRQRLKEAQKLDQMKLALQIKEKFKRHREISTRQTKEKQEAIEAKAKEALERRLQNRIVQVKRNEKLLQKYERQMNENMRLRALKIQRIQEREERRLQKIRANIIIRRYENVDQNKLKAKFYKGLKRSFRRTRKRRTGRSPSKVRPSKKLRRADVNGAVDQAFTTLENINSGSSNMNVLETAKEILTMILQTPDSYLPDDDDVLKFTRDRVKSTIEAVKEDILNDLRQVARSSQITLTMKNLKSATSYNCPTPSSKASSRKVHIEDNLQIRMIVPSYKKCEPMKSTNSRTPTPVPSLDSIVAVIATVGSDDPIQLTPDYDQFELVHLTKSQKILLERNFILFKKLLRQCVGRQCFARVNFRERKIQPLGKMEKKIPLATRDEIEEEMSKVMVKLPVEEKQLGQKILITCQVVSNEVLDEFNREFFEGRVKSTLSVVED